MLAGILNLLPHDVFAKVLEYLNVVYDIVHLDAVKHKSPSYISIESSPTYHFILSQRSAITLQPLRPFGEIYQL
jgi:hypothetical protein